MKAEPLSLFPRHPLHELEVVLYDCVHKTPKPQVSGYPYLAIPNIQDGRIDLSEARRISEKDFVEWTAKTRPRPGDVVVTRRGRVGDTAPIPDDIPCALGQNLVLLRSEGPYIRQDFLKWVTRGPLWRIEVQKFLNVGAVFDSLNCGDIPKISVPAPPISEQRRIAEILGAFDDKIELNRKMNRTLETMAQALFKSWFVDFDGHDDLVDSELGPIPRGWNVQPLKAQFRLIMGMAPPGSTYNEDRVGLPFFQGSRDFGFRFPSNRIYCSEPKRCARPNDTLISVRAPVGLANLALEECCIGRGAAALRHKSGAVSYTYGAAQSLKKRFDAYNAEGTVFGSIGKKDFESLPILTPPSDIIGSFEEKVTPLDQRIQLSCLQSRTLAEIRDALLPKLISGEIRVPEAEKMAEAVA